MRWVAFVLRAFIRAYQLFLSPVLPPSCRFEPSCSHYAAEAISRHGPAQGIWLAVKRLLRCQPWSGHGGYDPVPDRVGHLRRHRPETHPPVVHPR